MHLYLFISYFNHPSNLNHILTLILLYYQVLEGNSEQNRERLKNLYRKRTILLILLSVFSITCITLFAILSALLFRSNAQAETHSITCGKWNANPSPNTSLNWNSLNGVAAISANDVWAVGYHVNSKITTGRLSLIEHWDGVKCTIIHVPNPGTSSGGNFLNGVTFVPQTNQSRAVGYDIATPPIAQSFTALYC
jgi:hypothetical protein